MCIQYALAGVKVKRVRNGGQQYCSTRRFPDIDKCPILAGQVKSGGVGCGSVKNVQKLPAPSIQFCFATLTVL